MTVVITYLASDNARNRRRAKRAAERDLKQTVTGCSDRVLKAVNAPSVRSKPQPSADNLCLGDVALYAAGFRNTRKDATHIIK